MRQRPPSSTLFPYTTLFRSDNVAVPQVRVDDHRKRIKIDRTPQLSYCALKFTERRENGIAKGIVRERDRKSTRLNSSHANISYAVFCLKKKRRRIPPYLRTL